MFRFISGMGHERGYTIMSVPQSLSCSVRCLCPSHELFFSRVISKTLFLHSLLKVNITADSNLATSDPYPMRCTFLQIP